MDSLPFSVSPQLQGLIPNNGISSICLVKLSKVFFFKIKIYNPWHNAIVISKISSRMCEHIKTHCYIFFLKRKTERGTSHFSYSMIDKVRDSGTIIKSACSIFLYHPPTHRLYRKKTFLVASGRFYIYHTHLNSRFLHSYNLTHIL